jgi:amino acid efflux transporter
MTGSLSTTGAGGLTAAQGTAMYVGAVLGTGVIALPALAAEAAGPASLLAWVILAVISAPLATTFAALGARYPDAGGVSTYARLAFGDRAAAVVGWCFYFAVPTGSAAAALFAGAYVSAAAGGGRATTAASALGLMVCATAANAYGVQLSGRVQLVLAGVLVAFLLVAVAVSVPQMRAENLRPFAPHGPAGVGTAMAMLTWSFVGWEAITHLTGEFRHPRRDLLRATVAAVAIVAVLYVAIAFVTVAVLGPSAARSPAPLGELMAVGLGGSARVPAAIAALLLTFGTMNAYYAGTAKLGAALGRDGALPGWLSEGSVAGQVPRRSLALVAGLSLIGLSLVVGSGIGTRLLVLFTTGLFVTVYAVGMAAAVRLLPAGSLVRAVAMVALAAVLALAMMTGVHLAWALVVALGALLYQRVNRSAPKQPSDRPRA